jgi:putative ABC transport system permease protein
VTGRDVPEEVAAFYGIGETFPTLGMPALLGRNLGPSDSPDGQEPRPVVELHYRFWQRHFHGDPAILGKTLELGHRQYTIIGVTPSNNTTGWGTDVFLPEEIDGIKYAGVVVKLRPGVSWSAADAEVAPLLRRFAQEEPDNFPRNFKVDMRPLTWEITHNMGGTLYLLFAAVVMLLAIGCGNVSILLLARGTGRQHEFAVRAAVGASSVRIVRQLLTESLLLAVSAVGLYSVTSYSVAQRTNEFGIRIALGAGRSHVFRIVMASAAASVGIGVIAGVVLSLGLNRFAAAWVGNTPAQLQMVAGVVVLLLLVAASACLVPAHRAVSIDPMVALRRE